MSQSTSKTIFQMRTSFWIILLLLLSLSGISSPAQSYAAEDNLYFPQTKHNLSGKFLHYWRNKGGLASYGYPITEAQNEVDPETGKTYLTQWFERNRFELHPENAGTNYEVLLGLLGKDLKREALAVDPDFAPTEAIFNPIYPKEQQLYFAETGHNVKPRFATYWQQNGGLERFGFPISEEHEELDPETGRVFKVQWFERARFEFHPENQPPYNVLLGLLGNQLKKPRPGSLELLWKSGTLDKFHLSESVAVNRWGNIYLVNGVDNSVHYYNPQGQPLGSWGIRGTAPGQFNTISAIAIDHQDNVYVVDSHNHRIQKFGREGTFIGEWGGSSQSEESSNALPSPGKFKYPSGIAMDSQDNVYITDSGNERIQKFDKQGHFLLAWGSSGIANGQFIGLNSIAIDSKDNVYVSDMGIPEGKGDITKEPYLQKFDSQGKFITKWTPLKESEGEPAGQVDLAIDHQDNVYVMRGYLIQIFDNQGQFLRKWKSAGTSITISPQDKIYVVKVTTPAALYQYEPGGKLLGELRFKPTSVMTNYFEGIVAIAPDQHGNFYLLNINDNVIRKFDNRGHFLLEWSSGKRKANDSNLLSSIAVDKQDNVYVAEQGNNRIYKYDSQGNLILEWSIVPGGEDEIGELWNIAVDNQGNVYALFSVSSTSRYLPKVIKYDNQGRFLLEWGSQGASNGQFELIRAIATDSEDNVFVSDTINNGKSPQGRIQKFDSAGHFLLQWKGGEGSAWNLIAPTGLSIYNSLNRIYISDAGLNNIEVFDKQGTFLFKFGTLGRGDGQLYVPLGLAADAFGNVFVADTGNYRIQKFRLH